MEQFATVGIDVPAQAFAAPRAVREQRAGSGQRKPPPSRAALLARERRR
jgi:hypothetical protein